MTTIRPAHASRQQQTDRAPGVMFLIDDLGIGGAERALITLANNLRRVRPVVAILRPRLEMLDELHPDIELQCIAPQGNGSARGMDVSAGTRVRRGRPRGQMLLEVPWLLAMARSLARAARSSECGVISTFLNRAHTVALTSRLLFARDLRIVLNVHEMLSDHLQLHFAAAERALMKTFIGHAFPRADRIVTVADGVTADLVDHFGVGADRMRVIHNPLDLDRIRHAALAPIQPPLPEGNLIVAVGRLVWLKGFDLLLRAVARLVPGLGARLLLVGEGEERPRLERMVSELRLGSTVRLVGATSNPWQYMARARVVVVPSRTEAFPNVIGEALTLGVPVVAAHCSAGVAEYLDHGRCGVLVPPDDVEALAGAISGVLADEDLRSRLRAEGQRRVETFETARATRTYEQMMLDLVS